MITAWPLSGAILVISCITANPMTTDLALTTPRPLAHAGAVANGYARADVFDDYRQRKSANTRRRHAADLASFAGYMAAAGIDADAQRLATDADAWQGMTWGLVVGYRRWLLREGYAVATVNQRLSTVRTYARLAHQAGVIDVAEQSRIAGVTGYAAHETRHLDAARSVNRRGDKKAAALLLTLDQARRLKRDGLARDRLMMCLLLDHGLRVGELAALTPAAIAGAELTFYRPKVDLTTRHTLSADTLTALAGYDLPAADASLLGMGERSITRRVAALGAGSGVDGLSAHDCRHYCATNMARAGTPVDALLGFFGWSSPVTAMRYIELQANASAGVKQTF